MGDEHDSWLEGLGVQFDKLQQEKKDAEASISSSLQATQDSALSAAGVSRETAQQIKAAEQGIADFEKGRDEGRASGSIGLINALPPVQLAKAASRISDADDPEAEAQKIAGEKADTLTGIGQAFTDPQGTGTALGESLGKDAVAARKQGKTAEFAGRLAGHGDVIAATVAVGGGIAGAGEGGAVAVGEGGAVAVGESGAVASEGGIIAAGEGGAAAGEGGLAAAGEEGVAASESGAVELADSGLTGPPKTPPPAKPFPLRPTEFPKGPGFQPTQQPPGPAPDFLPDQPNPFEDPFNPRVPRAPRLPNFEPGFEAPEAPPPDTIPESRPPAFDPEISPSADSVPPPNAGSPNPGISPSAESVRAPGVGEPIPPE